MNNSPLTIYRHFYGIFMGKLWDSLKSLNTGCFKMVHRATRINGLVAWSGYQGFFSLNHKTYPPRPTHCGTQTHMTETCTRSAHTHTHTHTISLSLSLTHAHTHMHTHTCTHTHTHTLSLSLSHAHTCTHTLSHRHRHTHTHTYTRTHTHTL